MHCSDRIFPLIYNICIISQYKYFQRGTPGESKPGSDGTQQSHLLDLLDVNLGNPVAPSASAASDPWGTPPTPPQRPQVSYQYEKFWQYIFEFYHTD